MPDHRKSLPADVLAELLKGNKIEAIKLLRQATGLGLKESKDAIDRHAGLQRSDPSGASSRVQIPPAVIDALQRDKKVEAVRLLRDTSGLDLKGAKDRIDMHLNESQRNLHERAPGEVPRSNGLAGWIVTLAIIGIIAHYVLRSSGG